VRVERTDQALIEETRAGSAAAFEELMSRYERLVYKIGYGYTGDQEESLDVTQNVFLKVYERLGSYRGTGPFKAWLLRIAHNEGIDWVRRHARFRDREELVAGNVPSYEAGQESELVQSESRRGLLNELRHLNPRQRQAVMLRYFEKMSLREISLILNCTEGTARSLLFRGLERLRGRMIPRWSKS
jgi:RNA polymerase sigma-70 factor (ECF subfamily)